MKRSSQTLKIHPDILNGLKEEAKYNHQSFNGLCENILFNYLFVVRKKRKKLEQVIAGNVPVKMKTK